MRPEPETLISTWGGVFTVSAGEAAASVLSYCLMPTGLVRGPQPVSLPYEEWEVYGATFTLDDSAGNVKPGVRLCISLLGTDRETPQRLMVQNQAAGYRASWAGIIRCCYGIKCYIGGGHVAGDLARWCIMYRKIKSGDDYHGR